MKSNGRYTIMVLALVGILVSAEHLVFAQSSRLSPVKFRAKLLANAYQLTWDTGYQDLGGGWHRLGWFGDSATLGGNWIWHNKHGYLYADPHSSPDSIYFWTMDMGWLWTRSTTYPYLYRFSAGAWLWYQPGSSNPRWVFNFGTGAWESWL